MGTTLAASRPAGRAPPVPLLGAQPEQAQRIALNCRHKITYIVTPSELSFLGHSFVAVSPFQGCQFRRSHFAWKLAPAPSELSYAQCGRRSHFAFNSLRPWRY